MPRGKASDTGLSFPEALLKPMSECLGKFYEELDHRTRV